MGLWRSKHSRSIPCRATPPVQLTHSTGRRHEGDIGLVHALSFAGLCDALRPCRGCAQLKAKKESPLRCRPGSRHASHSGTTVDNRSDRQASAGKVLADGRVQRDRGLGRAVEEVGGANHRVILLSWCACWKWELAGRVLCFAALNKMRMASRQ